MQRMSTTSMRSQARGLWQLQRIKFRARRIVAMTWDYDSLFGFAIERSDGKRVAFAMPNYFTSPFRARRFAADQARTISRDFATRPKRTTNRRQSFSKRPWIKRREERQWRREREGCD
jgi:hypothetical protein